MSNQEEKSDVEVVLDELEAVAEELAGESPESPASPEAAESAEGDAQGTEPDEPDERLDAARTFLESPPKLLSGDDELPVSEDPYDSGPFLAADVIDSDRADFQARREMTEDRPDYPNEGDVIDARYEIVKRIGTGAFGNVFEVRHRLLDQTFALKMLDQRIANDSDAVDRFHEEARATSLIGHENIVFVTDFGICPTFGHYLVMEFLDGTSLREMLDDGRRLSLSDTLKFALAVGGALAAVHELGIVHRDLKPDNVMHVDRSSGQTWKILDFGISSAVASLESSPLAGTPAYMAPEQAQGEEVDHRADQFSLACVIYETLTGEQPWEVRSWLDALAEARVEPPTPPSHLLTSIPSAVDDVLAKAMSLDKDDRFEDIETFVEALQSAETMEHIPTIDPFDEREASRHLQALSEVRDEVGPDSEVFEEASSALGEAQSLVISVEEEEPDPKVTVVFRSASRLQREYRRNLIAGGLFVPTLDPLAVRTSLTVEVMYTPTSDSVEVTGHVVSRTGGSGGASGFGVAFDKATRERLLTFFRDLNVGLGLSARSYLQIGKEFDENADLSAGEAFILSRLDTTLGVGSARAMFSSLPFDFDRTVSSLLEKGYVVVKSPEASERELKPGRRRHKTTPPPDVPSYTADDAERVHELAAYHEDRQNYMAALRVFEDAVQQSPDVASFHHGLARLRARFQIDLDAARKSVETALKLDPGNEEFEETKAYVDRLIRLGRDED